MTYEQRIRKMQAEGLLSDRQAASLASSLGAGTLSQATRRTRSQLSYRSIGVALLLLLGAAVVALALHGPEATHVVSGEIVQVKDLLNKPEGTGSMNTTLSNTLSALLIMLPLVLVVLVFAWLYNDLVSKEEAVYLEWAQVESNFQRRTDLIPGLLETVARYMQHERDTLTDITDARGQALAPLAAAMDRLISEQGEVSAATDASAALDDQESLEALSEQQATLGASLRNLIAVGEDYPDLRSADQFLALQAQLEGTENRINISRMNFNVAVEKFNGAIRRLPGSLIAGLGHFQRKAYFKTEQGQDRPVPVVFGQE